MTVPKDTNEYCQTYGKHPSCKQTSIAEQYPTKDFWRIEQYFEDHCETHEQLGDERILDKCENYPQGYSGEKEQQGSKLKGLSKQ